MRRQCRRLSGSSLFCGKHQHDSAMKKKIHQRTFDFLILDLSTVCEVSERSSKTRCSCVLFGYFVGFERLPFLRTRSVRWRTEQMENAHFSSEDLDL